ncbi:hypothetical protein FSP39_005741 [Pinctada imbricata]|uniref:Uncharacterized protein n=1 Tax=Pinctada imbricata TaxID=66713 RepID=A0AA88XWI8_PINIB|nr:hypothetical protein FSP39_005741 [Pinctada imbricata]
MTGQLVQTSLEKTGPRPPVLSECQSDSSGDNIHELAAAEHGLYYVRPLFISIYIFICVAWAPAFCGLVCVWSSDSEEVVLHHNCTFFETSGRRSQGGQYETAEIEQKGLVLNNMESTKKNNEHVEMQNAAMVNETENKETEKAPLIGEGKQFETVDLTTPTEEKGDNLAAGGVFDGRAEETPKESEETPKESEETPKESDAPADVKNNDAVPKAEEGGDAENVKTDGIEPPPPPPVEKAGTEGTPADDNDVSKAPDEANKPTGDTMQESQPSHKPVEATISVMSLPPPPEESGDKIRESLDVDNIPPPAEGSSPKNNVSEAESVKSDDKVGDDMKAEEQTKNESTSDDKKDSTETSVDTENT